MRLVPWLGWLASACVACGGPPPPAAPPASASEPPAAAESAAAPTAAPEASSVEPESPPSVPALTPAPSLPPSTKSYEQAMSTPEPVDINDERLQLTDIQLTNPVRGVIDRCRVPSGAKVTIQTAVQNGRAIGVTVHVEMMARSKPAGTPKRMSKAAQKAAAAAAKAAAKAAAELKSCADHAVRSLTWPPSRRRDAFTTTF